MCITHKCMPYLSPPTKVIFACFQTIHTLLHRRTHANACMYIIIITISLLNSFQRKTRSKKKYHAFHRVLLQIRTHVMPRFTTSLNHHILHTTVWHTRRRIITSGFLQCVFHSSCDNLGF